MNLSRHLRSDRIKLEMDTRPLDVDELEVLGPRAERVQKERILAEIADFLEGTSRVGNAKRLLTDLINRERKAGTGVGGGLAIPHVRTMNVKEPTVALLRSTEGLEFGAPDGELVHIFLVIVGPPYNDRLYLKIYKEAAELFLHEHTLEWLLDATSESEVLQFLRSPEKFVIDW
ncbi:MAG: PTS sugar transporter subunit IIA [Planctomycetota bacterium]